MATIRRDLQIEVDVETGEPGELIWGNQKSGRVPVMAAPNPDGGSGILIDGVVVPIDPAPTADEYTDLVTLSATGVVHPMTGRLHSVTVVSGSCDLALSDGAGTGTANLRAITTLAGLTVGDVVPFPGGGIPFVNALLATITGTAVVKFEVA